MTTPTMTPAGWYPDPSGRHDFRYWDGKGWSSQISDGGLGGTDPQLSPAISPEGGPAAGQGAPAPMTGPQAAQAAGLGEPAPAPGRRRRWVIPLVAVIAVLAVIVGLGTWRVATSGPSAADIYKQAQKSAAAAKSVRITGSFTESGKKLQIDVAGDRAGTNTKAIVNDGTGVIEILTVGGSYYFKADAAYWTKNGSAALATLAAGKYVTVPAQSAASLGNLKMGTLLDTILSADMSTAGKLTTNVDKTVVGGVPAYVLTDKIASNGAKIYVSADGKNRLLRLVSPKTQGSLDFTQWDAVAPVSPPSADQIVKLPGL